MIQIFDFPITFAIIDRFCLLFARGKVTVHRLGWGGKISKISQSSTEKMKMKFLQLRIRNVWMHKNYTSVVPRPCQNQIYNYIPLELLYWKNIPQFMSLVGLFKFSPFIPFLSLFTGVSHDSLAFNPVKQYQIVFLNCNCVYTDNCN